MCDSERLEREWRSFITDMITSAEAVLSFTDGLDIDQFQNDELRYKATLWDLRIIGEAASKTPEEVKDKYPMIPWGEIIGMRNRITHAYERIDTDIVWDTIKTDIPQMLADLRELSRRLDEGEV